ncbi:iron-containing alcohol dehydrogenase [Mangrovibacillus cuniculi]|uniref:Iron-containing alcohol dehydrogenase n=1 Tax=Mangrovibacillus cuniculi TaxID=2593652 RepID=A0A7S8C921_9BACI|nr:iron-containing alcohol dehydrogenase [Mangrovibacillus cuniculi]QPC45536.1 iron-containing alcohol dehydrogenase [Mangrovibacillus cuniculi]
MYNLYCRAYQFVFKYSLYFLQWRKPCLLEGENSILKLPDLLRNIGFKKILIVTDEGIGKARLMQPFLDVLSANNASHVVYDKVVPNPTIENMEDAVKLYYQHQCDVIVAFGGGSSIDCAKGVAARVARPDKSLAEMKGSLKIRRGIPPLVAVPTTSGTGSEATVAIVVTDPANRTKYTITDTVLIPHYAVLDPLLTTGLPPHITAATGMDAMTHAIEAYIGRSNTPTTRKQSVEAVQLIVSNLKEAFTNGSNVTARSNMQKASYLAGSAFTRAFVGNVHAIAHTLGGFYGIPHGLANAVVLPHVLEFYGESVFKPLGELADEVGIAEPGDSLEVKAGKFVELVREMNVELGIPEVIDGIKAADIPEMADRAFLEANPFYPVPKIMSRADFVELFEKITG